MPSRDAGQYDQGFVADDIRAHAVRPSLHGLTAVCDEERIVRLLPRQFDPGRRDSCPDCVRDVQTGKSESPELM